jgi:hypothetical protein
MMFVAPCAFRGTVCLAWDPVTSPSLGGYFMYYGPFGWVLYKANQSRKHDRLYDVRPRCSSPDSTTVCGPV